MAEEAKVRVLVIDDQSPYVTMLERSLSGMKELPLQVIGVVVNNADGASTAITDFGFDFLVLDINLTGEGADSSGITVAQRLLDAGVSGRQIILHSDSDDARRYWASKLDVHHAGKCDISSIIDCIQGKCSHFPNKERP